MTSVSDEKTGTIRAREVLVIGESHARPFDGLTAGCATGGEPLVAKSHFLSKVVASNVSDCDGRLHPHLSEVLEPFTTGTVPPLVLYFADVEIHTKLLINIAESFDFELPERTDLPVREAATAVPHSTVTSFLEEILYPFRRGIQAMRAMGFNEIVLHGLPARVRCDARASYWTRSTVCPLETRIKVTQLANALLSSIAECENAHYVNVWDETSRAGILHPKYDLDGVHTTTAAAQISLDKIAALLCGAPERGPSGAGEIDT